MRRDYSMFIRRRYRGYWRELAPGLYLDSGWMHLYYTPPIVKGTGTLGRADTQEECESLTEDEVQYQRSRARTIFDIELGLVCAECDGEGQIPSGNDVRVICHACGGH
jgi:hypothetical protein